MPCHGQGICPRTRAYAERRMAEGKSKAEIIRCLKRYAATLCSFRPAPLDKRYPPLGVAVGPSSGRPATVRIWSCHYRLRVLADDIIAGVRRAHREVCE
jgi:hypothetical protein